MCAPFIGAVNMEKYLASGQIEQVICGGENYGGARPCNFDWVKSFVENVKPTMLRSALSKREHILLKTVKHTVFPKSRCKAKWHINLE